MQNPLVGQGKILESNKANSSSPTRQNPLVQQAKIF